MKFDILSPPDFKSKFQSDLQLINKNILYITHQVDKCVSILKEMQDDDRLSSTAENYYREKEEDKEPD